MTVAALYVQVPGVYTELADVEPWGLPTRDARQYAGPWPVVAHPPCARWGRYWSGGPSHAGRYQKGDDDGCFAAALASVRRWGGVLEHPADSYAWDAFDLPTPPRAGGWVRGLCGGWACCVEQGHYGHRAQKRTWLYCYGTALPDLVWGPSAARAHVGGMSKARRATRHSVPTEFLSRHQRAATPRPFAELLLSLARTAYRVSAPASTATQRAGGPGS